MDQPPLSPSAPISDTVSQSSPNRIRRNTACTSCRDSKVKCNASLTPEQPCQRCLKLDIQCVVDKSHKRTTRRSKLEQLEKEVQTIKNAVNPGAAAAAAARTLPHPLTLPLPSPGTVYPIFSDRPSFSAQARLNLPALSPVQGRPHEQVPTPTLTSNTTPTGHPRAPSQPRALGSRVFTGEDIDYYFENYFEHFHPYFPIIRTQEPDGCYKISPALFWTVITVSSRRYVKDPEVFQFLIENLPREIWAVVSSPPISQSTVNALLVLSTWPLPTIRFLNDPSSTYVAIAMNACLILGLHTGQGAHPEFCIGCRPKAITDEEASYTWAGYNIIAQRIASNNGYPAMAGFFNDAISRSSGGRSLPEMMGYFGLLYETQKFCNRVSRTMFACSEDTDGVPDSVVRLMEDEFDSIRQPLCRNDSDLELFTVLAAQLEVQSYYFIPLLTTNQASFKRNINRAYSTAQAIINLGLRLDDTHQFLMHAPQHVFRTILDASVVVFDMLVSNQVSDIEFATAEVSIKNAQAAIRRCSVQDGDFAMRVFKMSESYWNLRHLLPPLRDPISNYPHRIGAVLAFGCLRRWKKELDKARQKGALQGQGAELPPATNDPNILPANDPLQDIDWTMLMDDFDWNAGGEPVFLGLS